MFKPLSWVTLNDAVRKYCDTPDGLCKSKHPQGDAPINDWDVSAAGNWFGNTFHLMKFNDDISKWDVSRVTRFDGMFSSNKHFNGDISKWDMSKALILTNMFAYV